MSNAGGTSSRACIIRQLMKKIIKKFDFSLTKLYAAILNPVQLRLV